VNSRNAIIAIIATLSATLALAEDFKTINGKVYKDATIIRVEADGIILRTKTGISKIYFIELPKDVQGRFRPSPRPSPAKTAAAQREPEPIKSKGWGAVMANQTAFIICVFAGAIVIAGVVFLVVRRMRAKSKGGIGKSSLTTSVKPDSVWAGSKLWILKGERSGLLTHMVTESVSLCERMKTDRVC
jgi:hypothetical protein